jgi:hypothetical protein
MTPREHDTQLAEMYHELSTIEQKLAYNASSLLSLARAKFYYRGRQRVTDMSVETAIEILSDEIVKLDAYISTHSTYEDDGYRSTNWIEWNGVVAPRDHEQPAKYIAARADLYVALDAQRNEIARLEDAYTGWSRFFLVTSSTGHVHSSMHCSTCRPTTTYGWLPELSGKTERDAVDELGPTLCSVCYPSAPVEFTSGKKLTAAQAAKRAA